MKQSYEKPTIKKETTMTFPIDIINNPFGDPGLAEAIKTGLACRQCSSCHGCR